MHLGRIVTLVGSVLAVIGLGLQSASSNGEELLPGLNKATDGAFPAGFDRVITALWNENSSAAGIFVITLVVVLGLSLIPDIKVALSRMYALVVTALGVVMLIIGGFAVSGAQDDADALGAGFAQLFSAGSIPAAFTVTTSWGWYMLALAGALVAIGGVLQLIARPDESALTE